MRQQVVLPETPRQRRELAALEDDLESIELTGKPLAVRLRNFGSSPETYLASAGGPLPYMIRLREIDRQTRDQAAALDDAWHALARACGPDGGQFAETWCAAVQEWSFDEVNDLVARHNRWYPAESRLSMDPRTGDFRLVGGRDYRREPLGAEWALERFPPSLERSLAA